MFKVFQFNKPQQLQDMLNDKWELLGSFMSNSKTYFIMRKP